MKSCSLVGFGILLVLVLGCGPSLLERILVTGSVTEEGEAVQLGTIVLRPSGDTDGPVSAGKIEGGSFSIPASLGPVPGDYTATVCVLETVGKSATDAMGRPLTNSRTYELPVHFGNGENYFTWDLADPQTKPR